MNKNYKNGVAREYRIMKKLEKEGWFCIRSAGSHSPIDIIAIIPLYKYMSKINKIAEKDLSKAIDKASKISIMRLNQNTPAGLEGDTVIRFIQSKKTGYLTPQERAEKEELEQKLGIIIEVI